LVERRRELATIKYTFVAHTDPRDLREEVNELLSKGWELQGGLALGVTHGFDHPHPLYGQSLVKREVEDDAAQQQEV
jgi:hypothetical protein